MKGSRFAARCCLTLLLILSLTAVSALAAGLSVSASTGKATAFKGDPVALTATVSGASGSVTYRWQRSLDGIQWYNSTLPGAETASLTFTANEERLMYFYRVAVTDNTGTWYSNAVSVLLVREPIITATADQAGVLEGATVRMTADAKSVIGAAEYQWQRSADNGGTWSSVPLDGAQTDTLTFVATPEHLAYLFRVVVTDANGIWYSNTLRISCIPIPTITATAAKKTVAPGEKISITAEAGQTAGAVEYQWQSSSDKKNWQSMSVAGSYSRTLTIDATQESCALWYRVAVRDDNDTWYSNAVQVKLDTTAVVKVPTASTRPAVAVKANTIVDYDYVANGDLTITWNTTGGNDVYTVTALLINEEPSFTSASKNVVKTVVSKTGSFTSFSVKREDMEKAQYLKVVIRAQDVNYNVNQATKTLRFALRMKPSAQVSTPTIKVDGTTLKANEITDYDWSKNDHITLTWSAKQGNGKYTVKALLINDKPSFTSASTGVVKTVLSQTAGTKTKLTISKEDLKKAKYLKIVVEAQDVQHEVNGASKTTRAALLLNPDAKVKLTVSSSPSLKLKADGTISYDYGKNGDLTFKWNATKGNGKYDVQVLLLNDAPVFGTTSTGIVKRLITWNDTNKTSVTLTKEQMSLAKYAKIVITAQDQNYARNSKHVTLRYGIRFNPTATVSMPVVWTTPTLLTFPDTITDYRVTGDLTIHWSATNGNNKYTVKVLLVNDKPNFTTSAKQVVKTVVSQTAGTRTSVTISRADLKRAKYVKVVIRALDLGYVSNSKFKKLSFALKLIQ